MPILLSILTAYSWVLVGILICVLICIARFYEKKYAELYNDAPSQRTYYWVFLVPLALFLIAGVRYAFLDDLAGDVSGDLALFAGGAILAAFGYRLQRLMTGGRR